MTEENRKALRKFKKGDRVKSDFLGVGTVADEHHLDRNSLCNIMSWVNVLFDKTPPMEYNMGQNPTAESASKLEKIDEQ